MRTVFFPKWDWWLFLSAVGVPLGVMIILLVTPGVPVWSEALMAALVAFFLWILLSTRYVVTERALVVWFGPFRFTYPWEQVVRVRKGGFWAQVTSFTEPRLRLAMSRDNIIVEARAGNRTRRVVISPRDRERFLEMVRGLAPHAQLEGF